MAVATTRGSWISTLLGGTVLAIAGFGFGMLAGGLWESPGLVFHYLLGNTEEVALVAMETPAPAAERVEIVSAPSTDRAVETVEIRSSPSRAAEELDLPAVSAKPPAEPKAPVPAARMAIQVGAFAESRTAEKLASGLRSKGYRVYLSPGTGAGDARWRVRVGPFASEEEARKTAARLKAKEKLPTWVLSDDI